MANAPVNTGGRYQRLTALSAIAIVPSDVTPVVPCAVILVGGAGNLVLGMYDGTTQTIPVVAGQEVTVGPKYVKAATTATSLFALN